MRQITHLSLHRVAGTELRVISDVEQGVLPLIQVEEGVVRIYAQKALWPHRWVDLFILQDLGPLVSQLPVRADLLPGGGAALAHRPLVNIYDLADLSGCHVFINRQTMEKEGYWDDPTAVQGLLAHEHAHPLAENETTRASRRLQAKLWYEMKNEAAEMVKGERKAESVSSVAPPSRILGLLDLLIFKLLLNAPREVLANEVAIRCDFGEALLHLDQRNVDHAGRSVTGRADLYQQLQERESQGSLTSGMADLLLLIGDMDGYLDLALEVAAFYRAGRQSDAQGLDAQLQTNVFPHLVPEVPRAYADLCQQYIALRADLIPCEMMTWGEAVLSILAKALASKGLVLNHRLEMAQG